MINQKTTKVYHAEFDGQTETYNKTIADLLSHFVGYKQSDLENFVEPIIYAYKLQTNRPTNKTSFILVFSLNHPVKATTYAPKALSTDYSELSSKCT